MGNDFYFTDNECESEKLISNPCNIDISLQNEHLVVNGNKLKSFIFNTADYHLRSINDFYHIMFKNNTSFFYTIMLAPDLSSCIIFGCNASPQYITSNGLITVESVKCLSSNFSEHYIYVLDLLKRERTFLCIRNNHIRKITFMIDRGILYINDPKKSSLHFYVIESELIKNFSLQNPVFPNVHKNYYNTTIPISQNEGKILVHFKDESLNLDPDLLLSLKSSFINLQLEQSSEIYLTEFTCGDFIKKDLSFLDYIGSQRLRDMIIEKMKNELTDRFFLTQKK